MNLTRNQLVAVFNEWATRYADSPEEFEEILDEDGVPVEDYGERCAAYIQKVAEEMEGSGTLPLPIVMYANKSDAERHCRERVVGLGVLLEGE